MPQAIARILYAASGAPTMGGSYATTAVNIGAAGGPVVGTVVLAGQLGPVASQGAAAALTVAAVALLSVGWRSRVG